MERRRRAAGVQTHKKRAKKANLEEEDEQNRV